MDMTAQVQVTDDVTPQDDPEPNGPPQADEVKPGLWKLLVAAGGILVVVFVAMELVEDTYISPSESTLSVPAEHNHG
jgi:hypothetical protein